MRDGLWLAGRALVAVALMVGFHLLALAVIVGLVLIPVMEVWKLGHIVSYRLTLACLAGAWFTLVAVVPRWERFEVSGLKLDPGEHPRLFRELEAIANKIGQSMPAEVVLVNRANAFVVQPGGIMGFFSRRVMGIGLPLMQVLEVRELRAVLAHEFGHFHGGDTLLVRWIHKTRSAIEVALAQLSGPLSIPFRIYGTVFLRITQAISRHEEYAADALAARVAGAPALASGLRKLRSTSLAYELFWKNEVAPVIRSRLRAPLVTGFSRFLSAPAVQRKVREQLEQAEDRPATPYDSHPPLRDRIAALERLGQDEPSSKSADELAASTLLEDVLSAGERLLDRFIPEETRHLFDDVGWEDLAERMHVPQWEQLVAEFEPALSVGDVRDLPKLARNPDLFLVRMGKRQPQLPTVAQRREVADRYVGAALALLLRRRRFWVLTAPGLPVLLARGELALEPFNLLQRLASDESSAARWPALCEQFGIAGLNLLGEIAAAKPCRN